ncbi:MAG: hypothetical protein IPN46_19220 [Saprospiraceae bacterium]|nr:hypothetical protein [Saprospiraceae bacterium]
MKSQNKFSVSWNKIVDCVTVNTHFTNDLINIANMKASTCLEILGIKMAMKYPDPSGKK